jgi:hypothetical protein
MKKLIFEIPSLHFVSGFIKHCPAIMDTLFDGFQRFSRKLDSTIGSLTSFCYDILLFRGGNR